MALDSANETALLESAVSADEKRGLWFGIRLSSLFAWGVALLVALGSIRGFLVIDLNAPPALVYLTTAGMLLCLAAYGWMKRGGYRHADLILLKNLLKLNLLLGVVNIVIDLALGLPFDLSYLYVYLAPYVVFLFLRIPSSYFNVVTVVVTLAIGGSVVGNFVESLKGPSGWENVYAYNTKLRPEGTSTLGKSRTGEFYRASGYTGNPHDSANILGMVASFLLVRFLLKKKLFDLALFSFALISLTLTQSATNIIATIFTLIVFSGYIMVRNRKMSTYVYFFLALMGIFALVAAYGDLMSIFLARIDSEGGDWTGMARDTGMGAFLSATPYILAGHADGFKSVLVSTEIAFLKNILQLGIVHAFILFGILLYPLIAWFRSRVVCMDALPSAAAIFFGFMSLLHYGSLFRVTSVFLFYMFFAACLNQVIRAKESVANANRESGESGADLQVAG